MNLGNKGENSYHNMFRLYYQDQQRMSLIYNSKIDGMIFHFTYPRWSAHTKSSSNIHSDMVRIVRKIIQTRITKSEQDSNPYFLIAFRLFYRLNYPILSFISLRRRHIYSINVFYVHQNNSNQVKFYFSIVVRELDLYVWDQYNLPK